MAVNKTENAMTQEEYQKIIDAYKKQNPSKYEAKKDELEAKLKALPKKSSK